MGYIDARTMLDEIHQFSTNTDRRTAFRDFEGWLNVQTYTHLQMAEDGKFERVECSRYMAHSDYNTDRAPQVEYNAKFYTKTITYENTISNEGLSI